GRIVQGVKEVDAQRKEQRLQELRAKIATLRQTLSSKHADNAASADKAKRCGAYLSSNVNYLSCDAAPADDENGLQAEAKYLQELKGAVAACEDFLKKAAKKALEVATDPLPEPVKKVIKKALDKGKEIAGFAKQCLQKGAAACARDVVWARMQTIPMNSSVK